MQQTNSPPLLIPIPTFFLPLDHTYPYPPGDHTAPSPQHHTPGAGLLPLPGASSLANTAAGRPGVDRSSDGVIRATVQRESSDARDATEAGMTCIVGELNLPHNRGLLVKKLAAPTPPATAGLGRMQMHR
jgi:hypothetical protein